MSKEEGKKKSKKWLVILLVIVGVVVVLLALGGSEDGTDGYSDEYSGGGSNSVDYTSEAAFPMGTCKELEGTIVVMSIAADSATTSWDFNNAQDQKTLSDISRRFGTGLKWIEQQAENYGKNVKFVYNWDEDNSLFYTAKLSEDYSTGMSNIQDQKTFVDEKLSSYATELVKKYSADGIMFVYYFNEPQNTNFVCAAAPFQGTELGMDYPIETVIVDKYVYGQEQGPATYAHEVLHLFGAPDFYTEDLDGLNYGITQEFVDYCAKEHINEIMTSTYDPYTMTIPLEEVTNDLTDLTAYYIGWIDSNEECEKFGVANSSHK